MNKATEFAFPQVNETSGMTLRDYFAAKAMQGMLSNPRECLFEDVGQTIKNIEIIVNRSYFIADQMIAVRKD